MNAIYIQNKTGFDNNDKFVFIVNGREYRLTHHNRQIIEIPDGVRMVQIQVQNQMLRSQTYNFDLKDGNNFTAHCHPFVGFSTDTNLKLFLLVYLFMILLATYTGYSRIMIMLILLAVVLFIFFITIGRDNFFIIRQE